MLWSNILIAELLLVIGYYNSVVLLLCFEYLVHHCLFVRKGGVMSLTPVFSGHVLQWLGLKNARRWLLKQIELHEPLKGPQSILFPDDVLLQLETVGGQPTAGSALHSTQSNYKQWGFFLRRGCQTANTLHFSGSSSLIKHTDSGNHSRTGPGCLLGDKLSNLLQIWQQKH